MKRYDSYKDSGVKWLGEIPSHWGMRKMKFSFDEKSDKGYPALPLLAATQNHGVIKKDDYENRTVEATKSLDSLKKVEEGDFVISLRSFQGGIELSYCRGIISPAYTVLHPTHIKGCYFKYLGKSPIFIQLLKSMVTGIREGQNIDYAKLRENQLPIPSLKEQDAIASYLDVATSRIDEAIAQQQKMIDLLNERKQIIINNAVTKGLNPNAPMKDSGIDWAGSIPNGWTVDKLNHYYTFEKGKNAQVYTRDYCGAHIGEYPVYSGQTENNGVMGLIDTYDYDVNECLFTTTVGAKVMTPRILKGKFSLSQNCLIMQKTRMIDNDFVYYFLISMFPHKKALIPSHMQPSLRVEDMNTYKIILPSVEEQNKISSYLNKNCSTIDTDIQKCEFMISLLQERKQIIINDVVTGKVKVV